MYERKTDTPSFVPENYLKHYKAPCIPTERNWELQEIFYGTGIKPADHPMTGTIPFRGCGHCESENVLVIYTQWSVSSASGDCYWDYEIACQDCHKFTARSFSEND